MKIVFFSTIFIIEILATIPKSIQLPTQNADKLNHIFAFLVLYFLIYFSFKKLNTKLSVFYLFLFGIQIEIVQNFLPNRYFSIYDILADLLGILLAVFLIKFLKISKV